MMAERSVVNVQNLQINAGLIFRGRELFTRSSGIGFYSPEITGRITGQYQELLTDKQQRELWLPNETNILYERLKKGSSVLVTGEIGKGKSALIYGLRTLLVDDNVPYLYVDGHFKSEKEGKLIAGLQWAEKNNAIIVWDSLDYLVGGNKIRKLSAEKHTERSKVIFSTLDAIISRGVKFVGTAHDKAWFDRFADPQLVQNSDWQKLIQQLDVHEVEGVFNDPEEAAKFFEQSLDITPTQAAYMGIFYRTHEFYTYIAQTRSPDEAIEVIRSLGSYQIAKMLVLDTKGHNQQALETLSAFFQNSVGEYTLWNSIADFVINKNKFLTQKYK